MSKPILLIQEPVDRRELLDDNHHEDSFNNPEIIAIAIYGNDTEVPLPVATQRVFDGKTKFKFPTEITAGAAKTRLVYRYNLAQWLELLEITTLPGSPAGLKQIMIPVLLYLQKVYPGVFSDLEYDTDFDPGQYAEIIPAR